MSWLAIIGTLLRGLTFLVSFLQQRQLIEAGKAIAITQALELLNERVKAAQAARLAARNSPPDPHDPYMRDD